MTVLEAGTSASVIGAPDPNCSIDGIMPSCGTQQISSASLLPASVQEFTRRTALHPEDYAGLLSRIGGPSPSAAENERMQTQEPLKSSAKAAVKWFFDQGTGSEAASLEPIRAFLQATKPDFDRISKRVTRASADSHTNGKKRKRDASDGAGSVVNGADPYSFYEATPLTELYLPPAPSAPAAGDAAQREQRDRLEALQIWEQLELRHAKIAKVCDVIISEANFDDDENEDDDGDGAGESDRLRAARDGQDEDMGDGSNEDDDEPTEEELAQLDGLTDAELRAIGFKPKEFRKLRAAQRSRQGGGVSVNEMMEGQDDDDEDEEDDDADAFSVSEDEEYSDDEPDEEGFPGASDLSDEEEASRIIIEPLKTEEEQLKKKNLLASSLLGLEYDDDDEVEDDGEEEDIQEQGGDAGDTSRPTPQASLLDRLDEDASSPSHDGGQAAGAGKKRHPVLDDDFFSIDDFNRQTLSNEFGTGASSQQGSGASASGRPKARDGEVDNDFDFFQDIGALADDELADEDASDGAADITYDQFFAPPKGSACAASSAAMADKRKGKAKAREPLSTAGGSTREGDALPSSSSRRIRFHDQVQIRHIKKARSARDPDDGNVFDLLKKRLGQEDEEREEEEEEDSSDSFEGLSEQESGEEEEGSEESQGDRSEDEDEEMSSLADIEDEEEVESQASTEDPESFTARRVAHDLFADDDENKQDAEATSMSTYERRQAALAAEIAELERENVDKKDWTLIGEAGSRARPVDSLLQEDLEFEHTAKVKPQVTEEMTSSLEDLIKRRILENNFDDVQKRVQLSATPFLPSKLLELSDSKNSKSLADLYEDEYNEAKGQAEGAPKRQSESDAKLEKEHREIEGLFNDVFNKLDALSNAHFTPKAPKATIQNLSNVAAMSMESGIPSSANGASMLAPEEVYDPQAGGRISASFAGAKEEMTPAEKQKAHSRIRKQKKKRNERIERTRQEIEAARQNAGMRPKLPKGKGGDRQEKADALKKLIGNKGVSVVGKDGKRTAQQAIRGQVKDQGAPSAAASGSTLKL
ncbi:Mpp10-domain-containing protein [Tilletiaria anomala UBC 951]|uniref:Mpp10-domain-containing protein n=1 Tax=Tilletiaria anomala (strain ATCC 24038 / CBS 436.72 / UBC 951) TaxID=1037660 RepID=A0A066VKS4_TILAU|nr:Mpp10-domain-containing protein [Tilletiaria anomala UBC 951]KDN40883.1 Mpp10-domain-containing protein [Tilletiaria anomala UBC 951]